MQIFQSLRRYFLIPFAWSKVGDEGQILSVTSSSWSRLDLDSDQLPFKYVCVWLACGSKTGSSSIAEARSTPCSGWKVSDPQYNEMLALFIDFLGVGWCWSFFDRQQPSQLHPVD